MNSARLHIEISYLHCIVILAIYNANHMLQSREIQKLLDKLLDKL